MLNDRVAPHRTSAGRLVASVFSNYAGFGVRLATTLVTTPLFISALGRGRYGSWVLLWSIASYMTVLDLGLGIAIRKFVAGAIATGNLAERDHKFNACLSVYLCVSGVVLVAGLPFVGIMGRAVELDPSTSPLLWRIGIFLVLDVATAFPMNAYQGLITAYQRYEVTNAIRVGMEVIRNVILVVVAMMGADLAILAAVQFGTTLVTFALIVAAATHIARPLHVALFRLDRGVVRDILTYSGWVVIFLTAQSAVNLSSSVVVGVFCAASVVTEFYVAYRLVSFLVGVPALMTSVLVPLASERDAQGDWESLRRVFIVGGNAQALLLVPAVVGSWLLGGAFFRAWLGPGFDRASAYLLLLLVPMLSAQGTACSIALGSGRQRSVSVIIGVSAVVTIGAALLAGRFWGAIGVCAAYGVTGAVGNAVVFFSACRWFDTPAGPSLVRIWAGPALAGVVQLAATELTFLVAPGRDGLVVFGARCAISCAAYLGASALLYRARPEAFAAYHKLRAVIARHLPAEWRDSPVAAAARTETE